MNALPIPTDADLQAMLARRVHHGVPPGLVESIQEAVSEAPAARRPWWSILAPRSAPTTSVRVAWVVAIVGLLLAATVSALFSGNQLLHRTTELKVVSPSTVLTITAHPSNLGVAAVAWSPDGTRLATAGYDGTARTWHATSGEELTTLQPAERQWYIEPGGPIAYSPDGTRIAVGEKVYDAATGAELVSLTEDPAIYNAFRGFSPDGTRIAVGANRASWLYAFDVRDAATGEVIVRLLWTSTWKGAMAWSPDGTRLAMPSKPGIAVRDTTTGEELAISRRLEMPDLETDTSSSGVTRKVTSVAWSPDGTRIAAAGVGGPGRVWDATTGELLARFPGETGVEWSPDRTRLAAIAADGTALVWDAGRGEVLVTFGTRVTDVAWSPDGTRIAVASEDGTVTAWLWRALVERTPTTSPSPSEKTEP